MTPSSLTAPSQHYLEAARGRLEDYFDGRPPAFVEPLRYLYVNPLEVQFRCGLSYPPESPGLKRRLLNYGQIVTDRTWENNLRPIYNYSLAEHLQRRFIDGLSWEKSGVLERKMKEIQASGRPIDGCRNRSDLLKRYERIDRLFDDILANGFKRQIDLKPPVSLSNEMFISVGRSGRMYFSNGGNHRLFIAQILRLKEIPFLVMARDERWVERLLRAQEQATSPVRLHPDWRGSDATRSSTGASGTLS